MRLRACVVVVLLAGVISPGAALSLPPLRLAPVIEHAPPTLVRAEDKEPAYAWRALGPFVSVNESLSPLRQRVSALPRPLWTHFVESDRDAGGVDMVWPLVVHRRRPDRRHTRLVLGYVSREERDDADFVRRRWGVFPFLWGGRVADRRAYFAAFPAGGAVHKIAGYDRIRFVLFPLFLNTVRAGNVQTSLLWPIFSWTRREGRLRKWRVFPLVGGAFEPGRQQMYALWPLIHWMHAETPERRRTAAAFLPFYGQMRETNDQGELTFWSRTVLWPFFSGASGRGLKKLHLAWPLYQYKTRRSNGELAMRKQYFWPFFGRRWRKHERYHFIMWPFFHKRVAEGRDGTVRKYEAVVPFYANSAVSAEGRVTEIRRRFWPFARYRKRGPGERWSAFALWPFPMAEPVKRSYQPLWTVFTRTAGADTLCYEALWGAWQYEERRRDEETEAARWHVFPFIDVERDQKTYAVRLLQGLLTVTNKPDTSNRLLWLIPW